MDPIAPYSLRFLWSHGQDTTYFCTISDGFIFLMVSPGALGQDIDGEAADSVFIDVRSSALSGLMAKQILALNANKGVYKAYFSGLDPALSYNLYFKSVSDTLWRSKPIFSAASGQQKFNIVPLYSDSIDVRIIEAAGKKAA